MARTRLSLVFCTLVLFAGLIVGHLFRIQVLQREHYASLADRQHKRKIVLQPQRGDIVDVTGEPLAVSANGLNVYAVPARISNPRRTAAALADHLELPYGEVLGRLDRDRPFVMIQQKVNPVAIRDLREMDLPGVGFVPSSKRYYPHHNLAAQLIGYVGVDEVGLTGLEFAYDDLLRGRPGWLVVQRDARGRGYNKLDYPLQQQSNGCGIRLTIEAEFQEIVEEALRRSVEASGAVNGCVVGVRPSTGEILAMANYPSVDLNSTREFGRGDFLNLATNLPFEPGSTFKPFVACALLSGGHVSPGDSIFCENGAWRLGRRTIRDVHHYGNLSFIDVIAKSSNIGMAKLVQHTDDRRLYRVLRSFGFGNYTGSAFSGEDRGQFNPPDDWDGATKTSLAIGYGLMVTPLQMAMAYAALANDGVLLEPRVVAEVVDEHGEVLRASEPRVVRRAVDKRTVDQVRRAMVAAVDSGTGAAAAVSGFRVAGKTGTSMKTDQDGRYGDGGYISSFGGFFPAEDPQVAIYVVINEPSFKVRWGGSSAAPVFGEIIRNTLLSSSSVIDRSRLGLSAPGLMASTDSSAATADYAQQAPRPEPVEGIMPDLRGLPVRRAIAAAAEIGLKADVRGSVRITDQQPRPGTPVRPGQDCTLFAIDPDELDRKGADAFSMMSGYGNRPGRQQPQGDAN